MVGLEGAQRRSQICFSAQAGTLGRFRGEENVLAEWRQHRAIDLFRLAVPVNARGVEIVDAELVGAQGDGLGILKSAQGKAAAGLANDGEALAGFSQSTFRYVSHLGL